mmetsp:Transcript_37395/g.48376  ORF Transcript_37395/g.48376 Transcript_37395/m.48376 type:complete len:524 (-) Transcript_37395:125-1696(-)
MSNVSTSRGNKPEANDSKDRKSSTSDKTDNRPRRTGIIRFKTFLRNTILTSMQKRGWKEVGEKEDDWDIYWADREWMAAVFDHIHLESWQKVNHFRNDRELCRKDLMVKNLKKHKRSIGKTTPEEAEKYDFWPTTFVLPGDYALFAEEFKRNPSSAWIMKPVGRSQGKGIFLFTKLNQISKWKSESRYAETSNGKTESKEAEAYVVQRYVHNPFLVAGRKFDIRLYALVTSFVPLTIWLYRSGFCRFSSVRYSTNPADLENSFVHLTNVAVQKKSHTYSNDPFGGKWDLRNLKLYLMSKYGTEKVDTLFSEIQDVVVRSLVAVQGVVIQDKHCFELYGYDILFDDALKPWLVEVNASPSLSANTAEDAQLKTTMLTAMLDIVDMEGKRDGDEVRVGGFDLIYKNGHVATSSPSSGYTTMLGSEIPEDHIKRRPQTTSRSNPTSASKVAAVAASSSSSSPSASNNNTSAPPSPSIRKSERQLGAAEEGLRSSRSTQRNVFDGGQETARGSSIGSRNNSAHSDDI